MDFEMGAKREAAAWNVATHTVETYLSVGEIDRAKQFAKQAIENWKADEKVEVAAQFKEWLRGKGINLDTK
ncbi:MAG: hypothetical protein Q7S04_01540 [Candidatus Moranbacteria bacterium]|nr:hypothetical protein [Candidatus Moranbacteria bacterium]